MDRFPVILMAAALAVLTGCAAAPAEPDSLPESSQESSLPSSEIPSSPLAVTSAGEIAAELEAAIRAVRQPAVFDLSRSELEEPEGAERRHWHFARTELESRQSVTGETLRSLEALLSAAL